MHSHAYTHHDHEHRSEREPHAEHVPIWPSCTDRPIHVELAFQHAMGNFAAAYAVRFAPHISSNAAMYAWRASAGGNFKIFTCAASPATQVIS